MASAPSNSWWCSENRLPKATWMKDFIMLSIRTATAPSVVGMPSTKPPSPCNTHPSSSTRPQEGAMNPKVHLVFGTTWSRLLRRAQVTHALDLHFEAFCAIVKGTNFSIPLQKRPPLLQGIEAEHSSARQRPELKAAARKRCLQASHTLH